MERCVAWGCIGFEIDFLDMQYLGFDDVHLTPLAFETFLRGLSSAGARYGVPVQLCMPLVSDVLASSCLNGVSNIRASSDDDLDYASAGRWRIGLTSLLHGALDIRPLLRTHKTPQSSGGTRFYANNSHRHSDFYNAPPPPPAGAAAPLPPLRPLRRCLAGPSAMAGRAARCSNSRMPAAISC